MLQEQAGVLKKITELLKKIFAAFGIGGTGGTGKRP